MELSKLSETTGIQDNKFLESPTSEVTMFKYTTKPVRLCESNLTKIETRLLENNNKELVDDFMETLRYVLLSTINLKGGQITKIILRGGILRDTMNLSDPFSLDIELLIILQSKSYPLAEMTFELADYIYGEILGMFQIPEKISLHCDW